jgi:two-component system, response regulator PdtaR
MPVLPKASGTPDSKASTASLTVEPNSELALAIDCNSGQNQTLSRMMKWASRPALRLHGYPVTMVCSHAVCNPNRKRAKVFGMVLNHPKQDDDFAILVADDDAGNRNTVSHVLRARGFNVLTASDGSEAVEIVQVHMVHLVLIDMHMPRLTGLEALQVVRQMNALLPAILMTADATQELMRQAFQAQVYSVIPKPVNLNIVLHTLTRALNQFYGPPPQEPPPQHP